MSSNEEALSSAQQQPHTAAAEVSFTKLNSEHHAESSSRAESRSSTGKRSSLSDKLVVQRDTRFSPSNSNSRIPVRRSNGTTTPHKRKSAGFLLDSVFTNGHARTPDSFKHDGKKSESYGPLQGGKGKNAESRISGSSSRRSSPLSRQVFKDERDSIELRDSHTARPTTVDPAQLVQMALNLSESRKRNVSSGLPVPILSSGARRAAVDSSYGELKAKAKAGRRASYLDDSLRLPSSIPRLSSQQDADEPKHPVAGDNVFYTFTPATLSRAEQARRYFELASEHRRLLEYLPPLKSGAAASGKYTLQSASSPGSPHYGTTGSSSNTSQHQLGRKYNPLQAIRNRRLRNRERRPLTAPPDTWQETDSIRRWIDGVEAASKDPMYRPGDDQTRLPTFSGELEHDAVRPENAKRHRRSDTATSVITGPGNAWTIEPSELLADTYWVEKDDNKTIIEDRHGNRIFPDRSRFSAHLPRRSKESTRDNGVGTDDQSHVEDSPDGEHVKVRHRHIIPVPRRLRKNHISRSGSVTSNSSEEVRRPTQLKVDKAEAGDENIGPLERHMRTMIAKDEKGELSSPEPVSPDRSDSKKTTLPHFRSSIDRPQRGAIQTINNRLSVGNAQHKRSRSADGSLTSISNGVLSMDQPTSNSSGSPTGTGLGAVDLPPRAEHRLSLDEKRKRHHIPGFRSRSKERNKIDQTDFATSLGKPLSPMMTADDTGLPRLSTDSPRPDRFGRQKTADSTTSSLLRSNTADSQAKQPGSRRFFKSGRISELVRGESTRFGDRLRGRERIGDVRVVDGSRGPTDESDAEVQTNDYKSSRQGDQSDTNSDISPRASLDRERPKPRYYISNLPNFKSPAGRNSRGSITQTPISEDNDPFTKRNSLHQGGNHDSRLMPPRINLPTNEVESSLDPSNERTGEGSVPNVHYGRGRSASPDDSSLVPPDVSMAQAKRRDGLPVAGLSKDDAKRHWSISDQAPPEQAAKMTMRDIARIRALLLASGIKAREIYTTADSVRETPLTFFTRAAELAGQRPDNVSRKQETIVAARMLSGALDQSISDFEKTIQHFQSDTANALGTELDQLSHRAAEQLTQVVHETSDEADAFNVELTTKQPQEVKRVDDALDAMFRRRHRQFRLLRRTGFKLLEWLVLGIMWWVWFIVVLINIGKKSVFGVARVVRWLLWL